MISALMVLIAAMLNAFMDKVENEGFYNSIFRNMSERFWYKRVSWKYAKKIGGYKLDAWHLAKSAMIISLCIAIVFYKTQFYWWADFIIAGIIWNMVFNLFYNKIFYKK